MCTCSVFQNLPPVSCASVGVCSSRNSLVGLVVKKQVLMPAILRCDLNAVQYTLDRLKGEGVFRHNTVFTLDSELVVSAPSQMTQQH